MKENSKEEDMKILEELIENANIENMDMNDCFGGEHIEAIEHILSDYKRILEMNEVLSKRNEVLLKGNEEWQRAYQEEKDKQFDFINKISSNDLIPVQKVKDNIEKLKINLVNTQGEELLIYESKIDILQELLEDNHIREKENVNFN